MKSIERGYAVILAIFLVLLGTVVYACVYMAHVTSLNYEIAMLNSEIAANGLYTQVSPIVADMSPFNWAITAESAAFSVAAAAQASKKKMCNVYQYAEEWLDKWLADAEMRPYVIQVVQSFIMANPNNN